MKKSLLLVTAATAIGMLGSCGGIVGPTSTSTSSSTSTSTSTSTTTTGPTTTSTGPVEVDKEVDSGKTFEITTTGVTFASGEKDGDIVSLVEDGGKTIVYGINPGVAHLKTPEGGTYNVKVLYSIIGGLTKGTSLLRYEVQSGEESAFRSKTKAKYQVGTLNNFNFDAGFNYNSFERDGSGKLEKTTKLVELSEYVPEFMKAGEVFTVTLADGDINQVATLNNDASLAFKDAAIGQELNLTISYKSSSVNQIVSVNEGYNIYNNAELKTYVEDNMVAGNLNILRNIECVLTEDQYYYIGDTFEDSVKTPFNTNANEQEKQFQGSVYYREVTPESNRDPLIINGNYMQIDGSKLPLHAIGETTKKKFNRFGEEIDVPEMPAVYGTTCNSQEGIFRLYDTAKDYWAAPTSDPIQVVFNDLEIRGNSNYAPDDKTPGETPQEKAINLSRGQIAIETESVKSIVNNCILEYATFGVQVNFAAGQLTTNDTIIKNTWGANIQNYHSGKIELNNSKLFNSGSGALYLMDGQKVCGYDTVFEVAIDENSDIDNRVDADSPWLQSFMLSQAVALIASQLEENINKMGYTVLKEGKFNFEFGVQRPDESRFEGSPICDLSFGSNKSRIDQNLYSTYTDPTNPTYLVGQVFGANNSIIKSAGMSDTELGTNMYGKIIDPTWQPTVGDQTTRVTLAYGESVATDLYTRYTAQGKVAQVLCDINLNPYGAISIALTAEPKIS